MPKKQELDLATAALYFNLAAGEKEHLTFQEQQLLTRCMEANFPALKQEARRLTKKMPTPKKMTKKKMSVFMITMAITVAVLVILSILSFFVTGCDVLQLSPPEDILKHPDAGWQGMNRIEYIDLEPAKAYYYFLLEEMEGFFWHRQWQRNQDINILGKKL